MGEREVEMTRLWSKPGFEVLAVPGTSRITWIQIFLHLQASVEVNVLMSPFQEVLAGESQKQFHKQGEPHQSELAQCQQECTLKVEEV